MYVPPTTTNRVLYLLHGAGDNEFGWEIQASVSRVIESEGRKHSLSRLPLIVMPFGFVTEALKLARRFPREHDFACHMDRLTSSIEEWYRARHVLWGDGSPERGIAGFSMGGRQALEYGLAHAQSFAMVGAFGAAVQDRDGCRVVEGILNQRVRLVENGTPCPRVYCSCGESDSVPGLKEANERLFSKLAQSECRVTCEWLAGGHDWPLWEESFLRFVHLWYGLDANLASVGTTDNPVVTGQLEGER